MGSIGVGIVGAGMAGTAHAKAYKKMDGVRILGVCDIDQNKGKDLARQFDTRYFLSLEELLGGAVNAVSICTPHAMHHEGAVACARAGKHILLEKPMAVALNQAEEIVRICHEKKVRLMMGMTHRFYPELIEARRLVAEGAIGKVFMALDKMAFSTRDFLGWVFDREVAGGGVFLENAIHGIDRLRWIIGSEVAEVTAHVGMFAMEADTEDNGMALIKFKNGVFATMIQNVNPGNALECDLELYGSKGTIKVRTWKGLSLTNESETYTRTFWPPMINLWDGITPGIEDEVREFVRCLREDREPPITGLDGLEDLKVIMAIYESSEKGEKVVP